MLISLTRKKTLVTHSMMVKEYSSISSFLTIYRHVWWWYAEYYRMPEKVDLGDKEHGSEEPLEDLRVLNLVSLLVGPQTVHHCVGYVEEDLGDGHSDQVGVALAAEIVVERFPTALLDAASSHDLVNYYFWV
jgi:hypothetical protein